MDEYTSRMRAWGLTCPGSLEEIGRARRWIRDVLRDSPHADDAALIVSELGTNALLHTASGRELGSFHVALARSGPTVAISVTDSGDTTKTPHVASPGEDDPHGRGLRLVATLAERVEINGSQYGGRTVTAHLRGAS